MVQTLALIVSQAACRAPCRPLQLRCECHTNFWPCHPSLSVTHGWWRGCCCSASLVKPAVLCPPVLLGSLQAHSGCSGVFTLSPAPSLSSQSIPCPLTHLMASPGSLTVTLSRVSFGLFPGLVLLCSPSWTVLRGAAWTIRLLRSSIPPSPGCPCPNMTLSWSTRSHQLCFSHREGCPVSWLGSQRHPTPMAPLARLMFAVDEFGISNMPLVKLFLFKIFHSPENLIRPFIRLNVLAALCVL